MEEIKHRNIVWQGVQHSFSVLWKQSKAVFFICFSAVLLRVALPYLGILLPKVVLDQIAMQAELPQFIIAVGGMALLLIVINYFKSFTDETVNNTVGIAVQNKHLLAELSKWTGMDYENMESPQYKQLREKAEKALYSNRAPACNIARMTVELLANSIGLILYAGTIALIHPLILVVLALTAAVNWFMLSRARKYMETSRDERSSLGKKLAALSKVIRDPGSAKDMRLYNAFDWLSGLYNNQYALFRKAEGKLLSKNMQAHIVDALMILIRDGAAYALLIWLVLQERISLGDFVFIFAAVGALSGWISGVLTSASDISKAGIEINDLLAELEFPDRMNTGGGIALPAGKQLPPSIELRGVSYTYPKAGTPALRDISIIINPGEKLAIVGANGAGKTTLVKLICGLYLPSDGGILLGGRPLPAYNRDEYYSLFSVVFQDIHLLPAGIVENVSQQPAGMTDIEKVRHSLEQAGLYNKIQSLPEGINTLLVRSVNPDATELSGGEQQKLAMARALYKDAPVLMLDEPTAALDPIAESEVYAKYAQLTAGKTSVFISHRLASTRFCDRIILLDGNVIAEEGTHDDLMRQNGIYANMFNIQASYYKESS